MDKQKLKNLINAYMEASATAEQEKELRALVLDADLTALPPALAADVRLVRMLMQDPAPIPQPSNFTDVLLNQLDALQKKETKGVRHSARRFKWLWRGVSAAAVAAVVAMVLLSGPSVTDSGVPETPRSVKTASHMAQQKNAEEILTPAQASTESSSAKTADRQLASASSGLKRQGASESGHRVKKAGTLVIAEYYDDTSDEFATKSAEEVDAPVVIRTAGGELLAYNSMEHSPEAIEMIGEALKLLSSSGREIERGLSHSQRMITRSAEEMEKENNY